MSAPAKSAQEIQAEQLTQLVTKLAAEVKAKESAIKDLDTQMAMAEASLVLTLKNAEVVHDAKKRELEAIIAPLHDLASQVQGLKADIARLAQQKLDAAAEVKLARSGEIKSANERVSAAQAKLAALELAIDACKSKVASL